MVMSMAVMMCSILCSTKWERSLTHNSVTIISCWRKLRNALLFSKLDSMSNCACRWGVWIFWLRMVPRQACTLTFAFQLSVGCCIKCTNKKWWQLVEWLHTCCHPLGQKSKEKGQAVDTGHRRCLTKKCRHMGLNKANVMAMGKSVVKSCLVPSFLHGLMPSTGLLVFEHHGNQCLGTTCCQFCSTSKSKMVMGLIANSHVPKQPICVWHISTAPELQWNPRMFWDWNKHNKSRNSLSFDVILTHNNDDSAANLTIHVQWLCLLQKCSKVEPMCGVRGLTLKMFVLLVVQEGKAIFNKTTNILLIQNDVFVKHPKNQLFAKNLHLHTEVS